MLIVLSQAMGTDRFFCRKQIGDVFGMVQRIAPATEGRPSVHFANSALHAWLNTQTHSAGKLSELYTQNISSFYLVMYTQLGAFSFKWFSTSVGVGTGQDCWHCGYTNAVGERRNQYARINPFFYQRLH